nr:hypothetical protein [Tanacetum cinerariifolium]
MLTREKQIIRKRAKVLGLAGGEWWRACGSRGKWWSRAEMGESGAGYWVFVEESGERWWKVVRVVRSGGRWVAGLAGVVGCTVGNLNRGREEQG